MVLRESVRFVAEQDSLNASVLGPDAAPGTPEFDLFVKEVVNEMTAKAGQKCTAIRRAMAPAKHLDALEAAIRERLAKTTSATRATRPAGWALWSAAPSATTSAARSPSSSRQARGSLSGDPDATVGPDGGAFMQPILLRADDPWASSAVHDVEAFGPVSTIMPYTDMADAIALANRGMGSLALSLFTYSPEAAREFIQGAAAFHGRMLVLNRDNAKESTGHGSPLPVLVHGGPGRAGGREEMGGIRGVKHYMQRTAIQSTPAMIAAISEQYMPGGPKTFPRRPPIPQADERACHRRHAQDRQPHRHASPTSSISPNSPATNSTPIWTRKRPRPRRSSRAVSPTAISS